MPITFNKAAIAGSELPFSKKHWYIKQSITSEWFLFKSTNTRALKIQSIVNMPPGSFTENATTVWSVQAPAIEYTQDASMTEILAMPSLTYGSMTEGILSGLEGIFWRNSVTGEILYDYFSVLSSYGSTDDTQLFTRVTNGDWLPGNALTPNRLVNGFASVETLRHGTSAAFFGGGSINGTPNYNLGLHAILPSNSTVSIRGPGGLLYHTRNLDAPRCIVVNGEVKVFGSSITFSLLDGTPKAYALLSPDGLCAVDVISGSMQYVQLNVPAGGEIKQMGHGYYIAVDSANNAFLYNLNNGGTLIDEIDGVYNPTIPSRMFMLI